jgi:hypothetical protein
MEDVPGRCSRKFDYWRVSSKIRDTLLKFNIAIENCDL